MKDWIDELAEEVLKEAAQAALPCRQLYVPNPLAVRAAAKVLRRELEDPVLCDRCDGEGVIEVREPRPYGDTYAIEEIGEECPWCGGEGTVQ